MVLPALRNGKNLPFLYLHAQFSGHVARIWAFCRYIGEAENGRKLNFPSLDPLDSMLSDSESSISCPKSSHEQVEKLGKFEIVPKIRARLFGDSESPKSRQPQTGKPAARLWRFLLGVLSLSAADRIRCLTNTAGQITLQPDSARVGLQIPAKPQARKPFDQISQG